MDTSNPVSSFTSRMAACSTVSPGSTLPLGKPQLPLRVHTSKNFPLCSMMAPEELSTKHHGTEHVSYGNHVILSRFLQNLIDDPVSIDSLGGYFCNVQEVRSVKDEPALRIISKFMCGIRQVNGDLNT